MNRLGLCIYFTGLSGSGKTTISKLVKKQLQSIKEPRRITLLDGDEIRHNISQELGFSKRDRSIQCRRIGYVANHITNHKGIVLCSNIAPYRNDRLHNRQLIETNGNHYIEVYLDVPVEECIQRDPKGLYKINHHQIIESSKDYEIPIDNEITINTQLVTPDESSTVILDYLKQNRLIEFYK